MAAIYRPSYTKTDPVTGKKTTKKLKTWYIKYRDSQGIERRVKGFRDKEATRQRAAELERNAAREAVGLIERKPQTPEKSLAEHLEDYERFLRNKENTPRYVSKTLSILRKILQECRFITTVDLSGARLQDWLSTKRREGLAPRTCNDYLVAAKGFTIWLMRERRIRENPFAYLSQMNARVDVRRERRALTPEQFQRLIETTRAGKAISGISSEDRAMLYLLAGYTGLRRGELTSLTPESFNLDSDPPTITVEAAYSKHRRRDVLPLRSDLVEVLRNWLGSKEKGKPLWQRPSLSHSELMIRRDLAQAGIPFRDEAGRVFDFHSLRHHFASSLVRSGCHPKALQTLCRHSTFALTMDRYSHLFMADTKAALEGLPAVPNLQENRPTEASEDEVMEGKGVDVGASEGDVEERNLGKALEGEHVPQHAPPNDFSCPELAIAGNEEALQPDETSRISTEATQAGNTADGIYYRTPQSLKAKQLKDLGESSGEACTPACTSLEPQLARVVATWHQLPEAIKKAIVALVEASSHERGHP